MLQNLRPAGNARKRANAINPAAMALPRQTLEAAFGELTKLWPKQFPNSNLLIICPY